jgi:hypothetical protein
MVVAIIALVVALSGTAIAASKLISGDKLIKKQSLSGNRLRNHTITGQQVNLATLGKVPSAANADHASNADRVTNATSAINATNAANAGNANTLGGQSPSAFDASGNWTRSGLVTAAAGQAVTMATFGPFTLTLKCSDNGDEADVQATSSEPNSEAFGSPLTGTPTTLFSAGPSASFTITDGVASSFVALSGKTYEGIMMAAVLPGVPSPCGANALVGKS